MTIHESIIDGFEDLKSHKARTFLQTLGVILGVAIPRLVTLFSGMPTIITFWAPPLAFTISALVGVVFGIYPAVRAAEMAHAGLIKQH